MKLETDDERGLLLGEVTPEVKAFLEKMGRTVLTPDQAALADHRATKMVKPAKRQSRWIEHDPPAWGPLSESRWPEVHQPARQPYLALEAEVGFELGTRVATAFLFQQDTERYLSTLRHNPNTEESEAA